MLTDGRALLSAWLADSSKLDDLLLWLRQHGEALFEQVGQREAMAAKMSVVQALLRDAPELNLNNYSEDDVAALNEAMVEAYTSLTTDPGKFLAAHDAALIEWLTRKAFPGDNGQSGCYLTAEELKNLAQRAKEGKL